jgi:hypothetical protein
MARWRAGADIGCCGTKGRLQVNVKLMRVSGRSSAQIEDPDPTHSRPSAVFSASDRSTLEPDLRSRRRGIH